MKVGIVGGGVAGLAAAYRLAQRGQQVALYEASPYLGGLVRTFEIGGERIESFYHHLFSTDTIAIRLIEELGLGDRMVWVDSKVGFFHGGRIHDFVTPLDLLRFTPVSLLDRVRLGLMGVYMRRRKDWEAYERITAQDWIIKFAGRRNFDVVWGPLLRGKFGEQASSLAMVWLWNKIHLRFASRSGGPLQREKLGYLMGSFGVYIDELEKRLRALGVELHTGRPVEKILAEGDRVSGLRLADGETVKCDAVIAALSSRVFQQIAPSPANGSLLSEEYMRRVSSVRWQWAMCLLLSLKRPLSRIYWLNIGESDIPFIAAIEHTNFIAPEHYGGLRVLYLANYLEPSSPLLQMEIDEVCDLYLPHLKKINPEFSPDWIVDRWLFKGPDAQPVFTCNYREIMPEHRTPLPGLYLANMSQIYPEDRGQNYSIRMGEQVAEMLLADVEATSVAGETA